MRLVVDTNVFVSAALKAESWPRMVLRWIDRHGGLLKSASTEAEVFHVLRRPRIAPKIAPIFMANLSLVFAAAELVDIVEHVAACRDPSDDVFLSLAISGRADAIISGDNDLLTMDGFRGIPILSPAAFGYATQGSLL